MGQLFVMDQPSPGRMSWMVMYNRAKVIRAARIQVC